MARHAKTTACDLFDRGVLRVAVRLGNVARRVFAAFTGVRAATEAIHRDGQRLVRFLADRAVTHRAGLEPLHDALNRLDFFNRQRLFRKLEIEQAAQRAKMLGLVVHQVRVFRENLEVAGAAGVLQFMNRLRIEQVILAVVAPLILAARVEFTVDLPVGKRVPVALEHFLRDHVQADALDARGRPGEIFVHHFAVDADGFEDLRAAITLNRGDTHLGHRFHHAFNRRLDEILDRGFVVGVDEHALGDEIVNRCKRKIRVDGAATVADEQREMMHLPRLAGFQHQTHAGTLAGADQMMMQPRHGQQSRDRRDGFRNTAIRKNQNRRAILDGLIRVGKNFGERRFQPFGLVRRREENRQRRRLESFAVELADVAKFFQLLVGEQRMLQLDERAALRRGIQQAAARADHRFRRGHDLFANGINRRVRDLREQLLEIVVEQLRLVRENGQRRVGAHGAERLHPVVRHRADDETQILERVAEALLALQNFAMFRNGTLRRLGKVFEQEMMFVEPLLVRMRARVFFLQFLVGNDATLLGVHEEHAAGLQPALDRHALGCNGQHAGLRSHDDHVILGDVVARGAQAVAVETGANTDAVREGNGSRAVPRLHEAGMKFIKRPPFRVHALVVFPGLGNHHHHRMGQFAARHDEQLDAVVEHRRVTAVRVDNRNDLLDLVPKMLGLEVVLAGVHPVDVAAQRVDLAIVRDVTIRMRAIPTRKRVRRKARMHQRQRRGHAGVA